MYESGQRWVLRFVTTFELSPVKSSANCIMQDYTGFFHDFHERLIMPDGFNGPVDFPVDSWKL